MFPACRSICFATEIQISERAAFKSLTPAAAGVVTIGRMDTLLTPFADQIRSAMADRTVLRIRGGGSKDFYGEQLQGQILDTRPLRGVCSYEPSELVVTALAGTPLVELEALLSEHGQYLAFEPPHFGPGATVGGMVAAGLSGPARLAAGAARDHVLGVQMFNGQAQLLRFGGQVMKNVAGYDVSRLMAGSLGTLGLITEVSLKVLPRPLAEATLRFDMVQDEALQQLNRWAGKPLPINASCWFASPDTSGQLYLRLRGAQAAVAAACQVLGGETVDAAQAQLFWQSVREQTGPLFACADDSCLWRLSLPDTVAVLPLPGLAPVLEWGGALRWVKAPAAQAQELRRVAAAAGGQAQLFRRAASAEAAWPPFLHPMAEPLQRIAQGLRRQFDPAGVFGHARMSRDA
jgi:glycolate oxidase FAD binding subunit